MGLILMELPFVGSSVGIGQFPLTLAAVVDPSPFVNTAVGPSENPLAMAFSLKPFSGIGRSILQFDLIETNRLIGCEGQRDHLIVIFSEPFADHVYFWRAILPTMRSFDS